MERLAGLISLLVSMLSGVASGADPLPTHLTGKWDGRLTDGRPVYWTWTVAITKQNADGSFDALVDVAGGINCFTRKRRAIGEYDGTTLVLTLPRDPESRSRDLRLALRRGAAHLFEGSGASTMRDVKMYLDRSQ